MTAYAKFVSQVTLIFFAAVCCASSGKGHLREVWKLRLLDVIQNPKADVKRPYLSVFGVNFSPDRKRIVVVYGPSWKEETVVILNAADPKNNVQKLDISPQYWESRISSTGPYIRWAGPNIVIGRSLFQLSNGNSCTLPNMHNDLLSSPDQIIGSDFKLYDWNCQCVGQIDHPTSWQLLDVSPHRRLLCIRQDIIKGASLERVDNFVIDSNNLKVVFQLPPFVRGIRFAESGKIVCGIRGGDWDQHVSCWDVDTGKEISNSKNYSHLDISPAHNAPRIVLSNYSRKLDLIDLFWALGSLRCRMIWDTREGQEMVSWRPKNQEAITEEGPYRFAKQPYRFAISSDGEYIVEGGAGELVLSKIESGRRDRP